ncbi:ribosomal-protein-alanine N-acetyltransferase [Kribbella aluminosa]|uniref:Ribosomal-protein-alanine N-acetyltransferase n=1 Tax=Kribbella aluminosa TaxID=416017 RepID=A0ABS4V0J6_9ACTN|nr:GNAT family N-acetyltransferase [Kribbella aluminosa]MBP2357421.1 ribosomal-protein-alanine N-acetyltransferase [Kribbella aluminosa]
MYLPDHEVTLEPLSAEHADAVLAFELENRAYFASWIWDRGDEYFADFAARHAALLTEQEEGVCRFHLLVDGDGAVVGRVNLIDLENGSAELGYRIAEKWAGKGLATAAVRAIVQLAPGYGLTSLRAGASDRNPASQAVLTRVGFRQVGVSSTDLGPGKQYVLEAL